MKHFKTLGEAQDVFRALSAPMRLKIMELLYEKENLSLNDLALKLHLTNSAVSLHVKTLEEAGLIEIKKVAGTRGAKKICIPCWDRLMIDMQQEVQNPTYYQADIPIGGYSLCEADLTCGLATPDHIIGEFDNPRYFSFPEHLEAAILWFGAGKIEYMLPNYLKAGEEIHKLELSFEISSESPGYNEDYPSDIEFYLNDTLLGCWISPGDFGKQRGNFTPEWWPRFCNQYGLMKTLSITDSGVFIDEGYQISDVSIDDLEINYSSVLNLRLQVRRDAVNCGGLTLFGRGFGNYDQNILMKMFYEKP